ncbi:MAG: group II intron reverse transcriptase/maturase, partial [Bacteroidetes bacterium CHB5]|nr:group II intron reverse transcriptase/maturase [Bacteroidetes bacterium CHB5]
MYEKGVKGKYQLVVADKNWAKLKRSLKHITKKTAARTFDERITNLKEIHRG